jgi:hypothetical protein
MTFFTDLITVVCLKFNKLNFPEMRKYLTHTAKSDAKKIVETYKDVAR